ncbi:hypothetical protein Stube_24790 [Streptomyces tubercidicus]|uniref:Uncharacterized protein n=1 Tax=Streptomyces tubercidicus TaxID=47759 RepID=A0A640UUQ7_9ACTN|nr:hypothetical protein Stube_24790 [Streptomyces tubercidicus]
MPAAWHGEAGRYVDRWRRSGKGAIVAVGRAVGPVKSGGRGRDDKQRGDPRQQKECGGGPQPGTTGT